MKTLGLIILIILLNSFSILSNTPYDTYFTNKTLRIDLVHSGNHNSHTYSVLALKEENNWAGSKTNLLSNIDIGDYKYSITDSKTKLQIYSNTFCSLFYEWQSTEESKITNRSFFETILMPFPKNDVDLTICSRDKKTGKFDTTFVYHIQSNSYFISQEKK